MKIEEPNLPKLFTQDVRDWITTFVQSQTGYLRRVVQQLNALGDGSITAHNTALTSAPTTTGKQGDYVRNATPTEAGSASSKYVVLGWVYDGSTWQECRVLTGN